MYFLHVTWWLLWQTLISKSGRGLFKYSPAFQIRKRGRHLKVKETKHVGILFLPVYFSHPTHHLSAMIQEAHPPPHSFHKSWPLPVLSEALHTSGSDDAKTLRKRVGETVFATDLLLQIIPNSAHHFTSQRRFSEATKLLSKLTTESKLEVLPGRLVQSSAVVAQVVSTGFIKTSLMYHFMLSSLCITKPSRYMWKGFPFFFFALSGRKPWKYLEDVGLPSGNALRNSSFDIHLVRITLSLQHFFLVLFVVCLRETERDWNNLRRSVLLKYASVSLIGFQQPVYTTVEILRE